MTKRFAGILLVALVAAWVGILFTAGDSTAQLYRYTDKNGKIVFTDNPPPGVIVVPLEDEKVAAPEKDAPGEVSMPTPGAKPSPQPQAGREPAAPVNKDREAEMKRVADEEIQKKQEEAPEEAAGKTAGKAAPHRGGRTSREGGQQACSAYSGEHRSADEAVAGGAATAGDAVAAKPLCGSERSA